MLLMSSPKLLSSPKQEKAAIAQEVAAIVELQEIRDGGEGIRDRRERDKWQRQRQRQGEWLSLLIMNNDAVNPNGSGGRYGPHKPKLQAVDPMPLQFKWSPLLSGQISTYQLVFEF
nr:hypothetical protein Iba_chr11eCG0410 [Ipomoea batatas]